MTETKYDIKLKRTGGAGRGSPRTFRTRKVTSTAPEPPLMRTRATAVLRRPVPQYQPF